MTQDEIIKDMIAKVYGVAWTSDAQFKDLKRFAKLVAEHEREACIKACEKITVDLKNYAPAFEGITAEIKFVRNIGDILGEPFIDAIRARGKA